MNRLTRLLVPTLVQVFAVAIVGCRDGTEAPTAPQAAPPALATAVPGAQAFRQLSAGGGYTCGVTTNDVAYCWGVFGSSPTPVPVSGGLRFLEVSAGGTDGGRREPMACGIATSQRAYCWERDLIPAEVPGGRRFRQLSAGYGYACGVTPTDVAFCWGVNNTLGQLGTGGGASSTPVRVAGGLRFRRVFAAATHTCGATLDDRAYCWGFAVLGELGDGSLVFTQPKPVLVAGGLRFRQVKPGNGFDSSINNGPEIDAAFSCGITTTDRAYCWGSDVLGSDVGSSRTPVAVAGGRHFDFVHPGAFHACALTVSDVAFCWGSNQFGQLGTGAAGGSSTTPARVAGGLRFEGLTVGALGSHTCGVTADHKAYCWGSNGSGQLGDGTKTTRPKPVAVVGPM